MKKKSDAYLKIVEGTVLPKGLLPPDKTYSGRFVLRIDPQLHKALAIRSAKEGKSLNAYVAEKLRLN